MAKKVIKVRMDSKLSESQRRFVEKVLALPPEVREVCALYHLRQEMDRQQVRQKLQIASALRVWREAYPLEDVLRMAYPAIVALTGGADADEGEAPDFFDVEVDGEEGATAKVSLKIQAERRKNLTCPHCGEGVIAVASKSLGLLHWQARLEAEISKRMRKLPLWNEVLKPVGGRGFGEMIGAGFVFHVQDIRRFNHIGGFLRYCGLAVARRYSCGHLAVSRNETCEACGKGRHVRFEANRRQEGYSPREVPTLKSLLLQHLADAIVKTADAGEDRNLWRPIYDTEYLRYWERHDDGTETGKPCSVCEEGARCADCRGKRSEPCGKPTCSPKRHTNALARRATVKKLVKRIYVAWWRWEVGRMRESGEDVEGVLRSLGYPARDGRTAEEEWDAEMRDVERSAKIGYVPPRAML
jgi:hypothetical protein